MGGEGKTDLFILEDSGYEQLLPLTWLRPVYDLRCGILTLREKILRAYGVSRRDPYGETGGLGCRSYLAPLVAEQNPGFMVNQVEGENLLIVNGRVIWNAELARRIPLAGPDRVYKVGDQVVAARLSSANLGKMDWQTPITADSFPKIAEEQVEATIITWFWDLLHQNAAQLVADFELLAKPGQLEGEVHRGAHLMGEENIFIAPEAKVGPGVVLDAEEGPIFIDENATIMANAVIQGPVFVGRKSTIKFGARIYPGTAIGEVCKVGGEVNECIIHSYANKPHDGFLGHAYLGMWVNIGGGTSNSDMKNDYGEVRVVVGNETVGTGSMFVGCAIGDHTKTGINTMLNAGTVVGVGCNLYGGGLPPKVVPSFSWGGAEGLVEYRLDKFLQVVRKVKDRRSKELSAAEEGVLRHVFEATAGERGAVAGT